MVTSSAENDTKIPKSEPEQAKKTNPSDKRQTHRSRSSAHTSSGSRRRKPKRAKAPRNFNEWPLEDQEIYNEVTVQLRRWKATQRQCLYMRKNASHWSNFKSLLSSSANYKAELEQYAQTKIKVVPIPEAESVDLPPFGST